MVFMHDCSKTQEKLIDLIFDEVESDQKRNLLAEVEGCHTCHSHYRSMAKTLDVFDQATEVAQPAENYWLAYDMKLRTKLIETARPNVWTRIYRSLTSFRIAGFVPVPVAAALVLAVIAVSLFLTLHKNNGVSPKGPGQFAKKETPKTEPEPVTPKQQPPSVPQPKPYTAQGVKPQRAIPKRQIEASNQIPTTLLDPRADVIAGMNPPYSGPQYDLIDANTVEHLEKAQVLLRSFRNTRSASEDGVFDLAYEKQQSRRLLNQNIVLRRSAEAKGNLPTEELLSSLEPFLIDIANLPEKPAVDDIQSIKQRMQKREIVASLQIYSARTAPPSY
jgi:hypothetical protein